MHFPLQRSVLSTMAIMIGLVVLSGCKFLIPEDTNAPRYNTVLGGKRQPERNRGYQQAPSANTQRPQSQATPPGMPPVPTAAAAPPEADYSTNYVQQEGGFYGQPPVGAAPAGSEPGFWDRMKFWNDSDEAKAQAANNSVSASASRHVPEENMQLANNTPVASTPLLSPVPTAPVVTSNYAPMAQASTAVGYPVYDGSGYPQLSAVPPRPVSDAARLDAVRAQLEQDRSIAAQSSANLSAAASAEPSLLSPMPEPIAVSNLPPPPAPVAAAPAPAPTYQAPPPAYQAAAPAPSYQPVPAPAYQAPQASGGYNPMGTAMPYGAGYLPDSRYAPMRTQ